MTNMYHKLIFEPRDLLYFRDGRPVNSGYGANWPMPQTAYTALQQAFHRCWPEPQPQEPVTGRKQYRFLTLITFGPLPCKDGELYVPTPADLKPGAIMAPLINVPGESNLPKSVRYPVGADIQASKETCNPWISLSELNRYLNGEHRLTTLRNSELYEIEERPGIEIDPETHSAVDQKFFLASYLRLHEDVNICLFAECMSDGTDLIEAFYSSGEKQLVFGGQRGVVHSRAEKFDPQHQLLPMQCGIPVKSKLIKWVLLSPAAYSRGWLPHFLDGNGNVMLNVPAGTPPERKQYSTRKAYREALSRSSRRLNARLVAASIPKHSSYSGWNQEKGQPERTLNLVPPGSVFYFEAENENEGMLLANLLTHGRNSEFFGNQGFGMGVCTSFNYLDFNTLIK